MHTYTMEQWKDITTHGQQDYNLNISYMLISIHTSQVTIQ